MAAATLTWTDLLAIAGTEGQDLLTIMMPFLPALATASEEVYVGFIQNLGQGELEANVRLMYPLMSVQQREVLESQVYKDLVEATQAQVDRSKLLKDIALKIAIGLIIKIATAGVL